MCPLGLSRFNALDLSESPPPPPGEQPLFFDSHVSAVNVSVPLDAAQQQQLEDEDATRTRLVDALGAHLDKLPEAMRAKVWQRWVQSPVRLSGMDQLVAADADGKLLASLSILDAGSGPPAEQPVSTGLVRLSEEGTLQLRRVGPANVLAEEERWSAAEPQLGARPWLSCLLRRVRAEDVIDAATRTDLTLLYSMLGVRLAPYAGQAKKRKRPTRFPSGRVREERDDISTLLKLLAQMRRAGQSMDTILRAATAEAGREAERWKARLVTRVQ